MPEEAPDWTVEEAGAYLPRLRTLLGILRRAAHVAARARGNGHSSSVADAVGGTGGDVPAGEVPASGPAAGGRPGAAGDEAPGSEPVTPQQVLDELAERGVILRDPSRGLVDFPSRRPSGRVVLLCWQLGEDELGWWHLPEDGFAGRRPLPVPPDV